MNRITVEQVKDAYAATKYTPIKGAWFNAETNCACPLIACSVAKGCKPSTANGNSKWKEYVAMSLDLPEGYVSGFAQGVDRMRQFIHGFTEEFCLGYLDGQSVAAALFGDNA